jgi:hypothetical protein
MVAVTLSPPFTHTATNLHSSGFDVTNGQTPHVVTSLSWAHVGPGTRVLLPFIVLCTIVNVSPTTTKKHDPRCFFILVFSLFF